MTTCFDYNIYDSLISLGSDCEVAHQLEYNFLRKESLPFDWLVTPGAAHVHKLIENHFADFLDLENLEEITPLPHETGHFIDRRNHFHYYHDFVQGRLCEQFDDVSAQYQRRIVRFYDLIESRKRCLFIRKQTSRDSLEDCLNLGVYLHRINPESDLFIISPIESPDLIIEKMTDKVFHIKMSHLPDQIREYPQSRSWEGNYRTWNALLGNIFLATNAKKKRFADEVSIAIHKSLASSREVVFWGCGEMAERMIPFFMNSGITPKLADKKKELKLNKPYDRIPIEDVLKGHGEYFVIVTLEAQRVQIIENLELNNYRFDIDYYMIPLMNEI